MVTERGEPERGDLTDKGLVSTEAAKLVRKLRIAEPWERYDAIIVGQGASDLDDGFFETWADFANADSIAWFSNRASSVGKSYTNQRTERADWAQDIFQFGVEFDAPTGFGALETDPNDADFFPSQFVKEFASKMSFSVSIAETDQVLLLPGSRAPAGVGNGNQFADGSAAPFLQPGTQGANFMENTWRWPEALMLPAQGKISVDARIDNPLRTFLQKYTASPGFKRIFNPATGDFEELPNWYVIRCGFRGPRYLQFRGARSAA